MQATPPVRRSLATVIKGMPPPVTLAESYTKGGPQAFNWHINEALVTDKCITDEANETGREQG